MTRGYPWADGRATRLGGRNPDAAYVPANCVARGGVQPSAGACAKRSTKTI
jgi:hypothetical protein